MQNGNGNHPPPWEEEVLHPALLIVRLDDVGRADLTFLLSEARRAEGRLVLASEIVRALIHAMARVAASEITFVPTEDAQ